jgi:hypothetical protein
MVVLRQCQFWPSGFLDNRIIIIENIARILHRYTHHPYLIPQTLNQLNRNRYGDELGAKCG